MLSDEAPVADCLLCRLCLLFTAGAKDRTTLTNANQT